MPLHGKQILDNSIPTGKIEKGTNSTILATNSNGEVKWISISALNTDEWAVDLMDDTEVVIYSINKILINTPINIRDGGQLDIFVEGNIVNTYPFMINIGEEIKFNASNNSIWKIEVNTI